jgi:hypothetical protein
MTNPDRGVISPGSSGSERAPEPWPDKADPGLLRPLLWLMLAVSTVGNSVVSFGDAGTAVHLGFGVATMLCVIALIVHHLRAGR